MKAIIRLLIFLVFTSCGERNSSIYYIVSDNGFGLEPGTEVFCNDVLIGSVKSVDLMKTRVLVTLELGSQYKIPTNGQLYVGTKDFFSKVIKIDYRTSNEIFLSSEDTLYLNLSNSSKLICDGLPPLTREE